MIIIAMEHCRYISDHTYYAQCSYILADRYVRHLLSCTAVLVIQDHAMAVKSERNHEDSGQYDKVLGK